MIRHVVLFSLRDQIASTDPKVSVAVVASRALATEIPVQSGWTLEPNLSDRAVAADFAGIGDFATVEDLQAFLAHPAHVAAGKNWTPLATWVIADIRL